MMPPTGSSASKSPYPLPTETTSPESFVFKNGKKYKVEVQVIQHSTAWKIWQGTQAFFLTLLSLGVGLASQALWDKWKQAATGEEKVTIYTRFPPGGSATSKTVKIGSKLYPPSILSEEVRSFVDQARRDITVLSAPELKEGLNKALEVGSSFTNPEDKTTILTVAEKVAQTYVDANDFSKAWQVRMQAAQAISPAPPIEDLAVDLKHEHPKLGLRLQPVDTSLFKNHTLAVQKRNYADGKTELHVNAKLSPHARKRMQLTLNAIQSNRQTLLAALPKGFCTDIKISNDFVKYHGRETSGEKKWEGDFSRDAYKNGYQYIGSSVLVIEFEGVGKVKIASNDGILAEYNHLSIELDSSISEATAGAKLNIIFAALGLGAVSSTSRTEDTERIKVMQLFRAFYPQQAYDFERDARSFEESIENLKNRIAARVPDMQAKFKYYLVDHPELIYQQEVYPGQMVWSINGLAEEVRNAGGYGLMAGVNGTNFTDSTKRLISMLKSGALSTQDRFQLGIIASGSSVSYDLESGGAESVFVRLLTNGMDKTPLAHFPLIGNLQILYDLDLVERVGFVYPEDKYGTKFASEYQARPNVIDLAKTIEKNPSGHLKNEVCIRNRIAPQYIKGVLVQNLGEKNDLVNALRTEGLITFDKNGQELINGVPIDQFIHIGNFRPEYWT